MSVSRATPAEARLRELADRHNLDSRQRAQLAAIVSELAADEHAPSAVRASADAVDVHIADSLAGLAAPQLAGADRIADIGSGAGFPGLPLAIALPHAQLFVVDSQARKCAFLRRACRAARIENVEVVCSRIEEWADGLGECGAVVARALGPAALVLEYAAPLLTIGGIAIDWRGRMDAEAHARASAAAGQVGLEYSGSLQTRPFPGASDHWLHLYLKVRATPERFPRRAGVARKHPLGQA